MRLSLARQFHSKLAATTARTNSRAAVRNYTSHSQLPSEHQMVYEMCRKFADEELAPNAGKWDKEHSFPRDAIDKLVRIQLIAASFLHRGCCIMCDALSVYPRNETNPMGKQLLATTRPRCKDSNLVLCMVPMSQVRAREWIMYLFEICSQFQNFH